MPDGYTVVPESLRNMASELHKVTNEWDRLRAEVAGLAMESLSLGVLGVVANYPHVYNGILDEICARLASGRETLHATTMAVEAVAKHYSDMDAEYYEQFGYLEEEVD